MVRPREIGVRWGVRERAKSGGYRLLLEIVVCSVANGSVPLPTTRSEQGPTGARVSQLPPLPPNLQIWNRSRSMGLKLLVVCVLGLGYDNSRPLRGQHCRGADHAARSLLRLPRRMRFRGAGELAYRVCRYPTSTGVPHPYSRSLRIAWVPHSQFGTGAAAQPPLS